MSDATFTYQTNPGAPGANVGAVYFNMSGVLCFVLNDGVEHAIGSSLSAANVWTALQTFSEGISIPTGKSVTGAGTATVTGFATVSATTLTGTLSTATQNSVTTMTGLTTIGTLVGGTVPAARISAGTFGTGAYLFDSTVGGITTLSATTGTFTNVGGTLSTATQNSVTTMTGLTTIGTVTTGSFPAANLSGATLAAGVTASSLTSLGTLTSLNSSGVIRSNKQSDTVSTPSTNSNFYLASTSIREGTTGNFYIDTFDGAAFQNRFSIVGTTGAASFGSNSLTAGAISGTTVSSGSGTGATAGLRLDTAAAYFSGYGTIYAGTAASTATNHVFRAKYDGKSTAVNADSGGNVFQTINDVTVTNVSSAGLTLTGGMTVSGLAGTGTRTVVVDANGVMSAP